MGTFCVRRDMPSDSVTGVLSVESNCSSDSTDSDKAKPLLERKSVQPKAKKSFSRATADSASSVTSPSPDGRVSTEPINLNPSMNAAMKQRFNQQMNGKAASTSASCSTSSEATTNGVASDAHLTNGMDCSSSNDVSDEDIVMVSQKRRSEVTQESVRIKRSKLHTDDKGTSTTDIGQLNMQALVAKKIREDASSALLLRLRTNCGCHTKLTKLEAEVEQWKQRASNLQETTERLTKQMQELMETKKQRASVKVQADHHDIGETLQKMPPSTTPRASSAALTNGINRASTCQVCLPDILAFLTLPMVPHQPHPISAGFSSAAASSSASQDHNRAAVYSPPKKKVPQAVVQPAPSLAAVPFALAPAANSRSTARASAGGASYNGAITHGGNVAQMQNQQQQQPQSRAVKPPSSAATVNARAAVANSISNLANNSARAPTANTVPPGNRPAFQQNPQSQNSNSATQRGRQSNHPPAATNNTPQASNQINSSISSTPAGGTAATCRKSTAQLNTNVRAYAPASGSPPHNPQPLRTSVRPAGPVVPSVLIDLTADDDEPMIVAENIVTAPVNNNNAPNAGATFQGTLGATNVVTHTSAYASPMAASTPLPQNNNNNSNIPPPSYQAAQPPSQAIRQMASVGHFNPSSTSGTTSSGLNNNMTPLSLPMPPLIRGFTPAATAVVGAANGGGGGSASTADVTVSYAFVDVYDPTFRQPMKHSPPMPIDTSGPNVAAVKPLSLPGPPGPRLTVNPFDGQGIRLKWDMDVPAGMTIDKYEIFAKQNDSDQPNSIGTVTALPLPMACTLTQFHVGDRYLFQVRALDSDGNWGPMSAPADISI